MKKAHTDAILAFAYGITCGYVVGIFSANLSEFNLLCSVGKVKSLSSSMYNAAILPRTVDRPFSPERHLHRATARENGTNQKAPSHTPLRVGGGNVTISGTN